MKVTSLRDVEAYIYSSVVLPLKKLNVEYLEIQSPIRDETGQVWQLSLNQTPITGNFRRRYQRTQAERKRNWNICLTTGRETFVVGEYNIKNHWVKLYEAPFRKVNAIMLLGKLHDVLNRNTPFTKIIVLQGEEKAKAIIPDDRYSYYDARMQRPLPTVDTDDVDDDSGEDWDY